MPRPYNRSLRPQYLGRRLRKKKDDREFTNRAAIQLFQPETQLLRQGTPLLQQETLLLQPD
jgi:hypothetical protein